MITASCRQPEVVVLVIRFNGRGELVVDLGRHLISCIKPLRSKILDRQGTKYVPRYLHVLCIHPCSCMGIVMHSHVTQHKSKAAKRRRQLCRGTIYRIPRLNTIQRELCDLHAYLIQYNQCLHRFLLTLRPNSFMECWVLKRPRAIVYMCFFGCATLSSWLNSPPSPPFAPKLALAKPSA